jgi:ribose transport system ATP-binding protein
MRITDLFAGRLQGVSFDLRHGEVLGVAGLEGSGRDQLPYLLYGVRRWDRGSVEIDGHEFSKLTSPTAMAKGIGFVGHRDKGSAIGTMSVRENLTLPQIPASTRLKWLAYRRERQDVRVWLSRLDVRPPDPDRLLASLSGGNQQKVVLARWLRCAPRVMIVADPTRGVDIGAKTQIYGIILEAARAGTSFLIASSDAEELATICDRVLVLRNGRVAALLEGDALSEDAIVRESIGTFSMEKANTA